MDSELLDLPLAFLIFVNVLILVLFLRWVTGGRRANGDPEGTPVENDFRQLINTVDSVWKDELTPAQIRKIEQEIEAEQRRLLDRAEAEAKAIKSAITGNDTAEVGQIKRRYDRLRGYQLSIERLTAARKRLYKKRQRRHIWIELNQWLGNRFVWGLEWAVLILIIVVLMILFAEPSIGYDVLDETTLFFIAGQAVNALWAFYFVDLTACIIFIIEFLLRLRVANDKKWFWRHNWIDLASSIPVPPYFGATDMNTLFRILRLFRLMRLFRVARIVDIFWNGMERLERNVDMNLVTKSAVALFVLLVVGASAVTVVEPVGSVPDEPRSTTQLANARTMDASARQPAHEIAIESETLTFEGFSETLWWTFNAIAPNAGYADLHKPTHNFTRLVTAMLLLWGAVVMGAFIATLTASFNGERTEELRLKQLELSASLEQVRKSQTVLENQFRGTRDHTSG